MDANAPLDDRGLPVGYAFKPDSEITPREVKARLDAGVDFDLIDCRRLDEWQLTHIDGATLIPLQEAPSHFAQKLDGRQHREVIVHCRSGVRSLKFVDWLRASGFTNARSMAGGILLWNRDIRPGPMY